jgi:hypothetical protein
MMKKEQKRYTLEVWHVKNGIQIGNPICQIAMISGKCPEEVIIKGLRSQGYMISKKNLVKARMTESIVARTMLLGAGRESITYYNIVM